MKIRRDGILELQPTTDTYTEGEALAAQAGTNSVLTFNFTDPVDLVWVMSIDASSNESTAWADPFGGTPSNGVGIPCLDRAQQPITVVTSQVKVWAAGSTTVAVWGFRYG